MAGTEAHGAQSASGAHPPQKTSRKVLRWLGKTLWTILLGAIGSLLAAYILSWHVKPELALPTPMSAAFSISITEVPYFLSRGEQDPSQPTQRIKGEVGGMRNPSEYSEYQVVIYSYTNQWYIQPGEGKSSFTAIKPSGEWDEIIHGGSYYAAILVKGEPPLPPKTLSLPAMAPQVITWEIQEGRSKIWNYFWHIFPGALVVAAVFTWWLNRRKRAPPVAVKGEIQ